MWPKIFTFSQLSGLLSVIVLFIEKTNHDHYYCLNDQPGKVCNTDVPYDYLSPDINVDGDTYSESNILRSLIRISQQRVELKEQARNQSSSTEWFEACSNRITGSKCEQILTRKEKTIVLLQFCVYPGPMLLLSKLIAWGTRNEAKACQSYVKYMNPYWNTALETRGCGLVVHPGKCWLGVSADAWVTDPSVTTCNGIIESKYPFTKAGIHPEEACINKDFAAPLWMETRSLSMAFLTTIRSSCSCSL